MATIKKYTKSNGETGYMTNLYLGVDPVTGKKKRTTLRASTQKELNLKIARLQIKIENEGFKENTIYTYNDVYLLWFTHYKNTVKESTYVKTERIFKNHIIPYFGDKRIDKINVTMCQRAINDWFKILKKCNIIMNYTAKVFDYAITLQIINDNPAKKITKPVKKNEFIEEHPQNYYSRDELLTFMKALKDNGNDARHQKIYTFFRILAFTGMRKGEAFALTWDDVNFDDATISITKTLAQGENHRLIIQTPKTKKSARKISIDKQTLDDLNTWKKTQKAQYFELGFNTNKKGQLIFSNHVNELMQPVKTRKWLLEVQNKYNLKKITTHGLRHTHCSLLFESSTSENPVKIQDVQDRLGHSDIQTTMNIYNHVTEKAKEKTAEIFANYMM
ncbi:site-specific integrase [Carnobacterium maltaromaticum]|uniref:site-specific integrase n=1 Tax=Carnobacterium maltaromaticum TaxID=2751 RepID=UPI0012FCDFD5|nr:site-specific integrase [Carnobacterium maltaromaticum]